MRYAITAESGGERILKIGQHCRNYGQESKWVFFSEHNVLNCRNFDKSTFCKARLKNS